VLHHSFAFISVALAKMFIVILNLKVYTSARFVV